MAFFDVFSFEVSPSWSPFEVSPFDVSLFDEFTNDVRFFNGVLLAINRIVPMQGKRVG